jgi:hypothetical protein
VKAFGIAAIALVLLFALVLVTGIGGPHGPGRHMPSGTAGGDPPPADAAGGGIARPRS